MRAAGHFGWSSGNSFKVLKAQAKGGAKPAATGINGFAAGALLVMLTDSMIPDAEKKAPGKAGLATVLGFAAAMSLSLLQ